MLGSSLPFPAGFSSTSFSSTISKVISTFPYKTWRKWQYDPANTCTLLILSGYFWTYPNHMFSILLNQARPPASHWLLGEQGGSLWSFGQAWAFHARYHLHAAFLWAFSWRDQMQQIQLHCACSRVMDKSCVFQFLLSISFNTFVCILLSGLAVEKERNWLT